MKSYLGYLFLINLIVNLSMININVYYIRFTIITIPLVGTVSGGSMVCSQPTQLLRLLFAFSQSSHAAKINRCKSLPTAITYYRSVNSSGLIVPARPRRRRRGRGARRGGGANTERLSGGASEAHRLAAYTPPADY